jgi:parallel beta-helix repeat protein
MIKALQIAGCGFLISGFFFLNLKTAHAAEIYVDANAPLGGNGTPESPLSTLSESLALIIPGEANNIYAVGTFAEQTRVTQAQEGTSEETRTVFQPWPGGERPVVDVRDGDRLGRPIYDVFYIDNADYVTIKGFEIMGGLATDIWFKDGSSYGIAEENITWGAGVKGICFRNAPYGKIFNNISYNNGEHGIVLPEESDFSVVEGNTVYGNAISGINVSPAASNITVRGNTTYGNNTQHVQYDGGGIVIVGGSGASRAVVEDNYVHDEVTAISIGPREHVVVARNRIENSEETPLNLRELKNSSILSNQLENNSYGMAVERGEGILVDGNTVTGTLVRPAVSVNSSTKVELKNNVLHHNSLTGIELRGSDVIKITNNTILAQTTGLSIDGAGQVETPRIGIFNNTFDQNPIVYSILRTNLRRVQADFNTYSNYTFYIVGKPWTPEWVCARTGQECHSNDRGD